MWLVETKVAIFDEAANVEPKAEAAGAWSAKVTATMGSRGRMPRSCKTILKDHLTSWPQAFWLKPVGTRRKDKGQEVANA